MYSERTIDGIDRDPAQYFKRYNAKTPEKGGCRKDSAGTEERLLATRRQWADVQNQHLERHGHTVRVDHRSLKEQGIDRDPEIHLGGRGVRKLKETDISSLLERRAAEGELERAQKQIGLIDLSGDLVAAKADRAHQQQKAAREFARQAAAQFKAEQAVRDFARNAAEQFKAEMTTQVQAEEARQKQEAEAKKQAEPNQQKSKNDRDHGWSR